MLSLNMAPQIAIGIAGFLLLALWHLGRWNAARELRRKPNGAAPAQSHESGTAGGARGDRFAAEVIAPGKELEALCRILYSSRQP